MKVFPLLAAAALAASPALAQTGENDDREDESAMDQGMTGQKMMGQGMMGQGMMGQGMGRGMMAPVMIAIMDTNGDGALSLREMEAVHERLFDVYDQDDDGELTLDEVGMGKGTKMGARRGGGRSAKGMMGADGGCCPMKQSGHMMGPMMMAMLDTDSDQALSLEEIEAAHQRMFDMIDENGDREVTPEELRAFFGSPVR